MQVIYHIPFRNGTSYSWVADVAIDSGSKIQPFVYVVFFFFLWPWVFFGPLYRLGKNRGFTTADLNPMACIFQERLKNRWIRAMGVCITDKAMNIYKDTSCSNFLGFQKSVK